MNVYKRLFQYLIPYKGSLLVGILLTLCAGAAEVLVSGVIYVTTNGLMNRDVVTLAGVPHLPKFLQISFSVIYVPVIIVGVFVIKGFLSYSSKYLLAIVGLRTVRDVQDDIYRHVNTLSCDYFTQKRSGDLLSRITNDVKGIQNSITSVTLDAFKSPVTIMFTLPVIIVMGGWVALISVAVFPIVAVPIVALGRKLRKLTRRILESNADITSYLSEKLMGMRIIKIFNAEENENEKFCELTDSIYNSNRKAFRVTEIQRPVIEVMGAVGVAIAIYFALKTLPFDRFMTFAGSLYLLYEPVKKLSKINSVVQQTIAHGVRIFEVIDTPPTIVDAENAVALDGPVESIEFKNVSFAYDETVVLKNVSFAVNSGEAIALVGASGSGKSTIVNLVPRFYDPFEGEVLVNGKNINGYTTKSLRGMISLVSQDTILFSGSVRENILYGKPDATFEEVVQAANAANAHEFIRNLPNGYDTVIGERGLKLSGGQRQRLSIARAIIKNPPILIFDEATSHLDTESEREVQKAIENLMQGRTVFVIAHRLSTIQNADRIIVVHEGGIVESGTHAELINKDGQYKKLYDLQFNC